MVMMFPMISDATVSGTMKLSAFSERRLSIVNED